jgi:hypothetical protein
VIDSPAGTLVLTAAHCISGTGAGMLFVPGYSAGARPDGVWTVVAAYVDPQWLNQHDPAYDVVALQLAPQTIDGRLQRIEDVVPGIPVGTAAPADSTVQAIAYAPGTGDQQLSCTAIVYRSATYPAFDCHGYFGGTSGGPWLADEVAPSPTANSKTSDPGHILRGLIGGLHQGGCDEGTSYSPPFGDQVAALVGRAAAGGAADTLPEVPDDC